MLYTPRNAAYQGDEVSQGINTAQPIPKNEQEILAQLNDIYLPDAVGFWPPSINLILLALVISGASLYLGYYLYRKRAKNKYRLVAIEALKEVQQSTLPSNAIFTKVNTLLKRCALSAVSDSAARKKISTMWGETFYQLLFTTTTLPNGIAENHIDKHIEDWTKLHYQADHSDVDSSNAINDFFVFSERWIKKHSAKSILRSLNDSVLKGAESHD